MTDQTTVDDPATRWIVVTGATRGIGAAIAHALDTPRTQLVLVGRDLRGLAALADQLNGDPVLVEADLAEPEGPTRVVEAVESRTEALHVLVNNAGLAVRAPVEETDAATIDRLLAVNVRAPLLLIAGLTPLLRAANGASVVNLSSISGRVGAGHRSAYAATKGAVDAATRALAYELGPDQVRVNSVAPGVVDTQMWAANKQIPGVVRAVEELTPLRRWAQPDDIASVVAFLASDAARFVTGEVIGADGGMATTIGLPTGAV